MNDEFKRFSALVAENKKTVRVNAGVLRSAINEINVHVSVNGKGVMTDMVLNALKAAIERAV